MAVLELTTSPAGVLVVLLIVTLVAVGVAVRTWLRDRPPRRSSARERLIARNPGLNVVSAADWSRRAVRVRFGWLTALVVAVAVLVASDRPTSVVGNVGDVDGGR